MNLANNFSATTMKQILDGDIYNDLQSLRGTHKFDQLINAIIDEKLVTHIQRCQWAGPTQPSPAWCGSA